MKKQAVSEWTGDKRNHVLDAEAMYLMTDCDVIRNTTRKQLRGIPFAHTSALLIVSGTFISAAEFLARLSTYTTGKGMTAKRARAHSKKAKRKDT